MVTFAMLLAIEVVLAFTPLGFLRIGFLSITMLHIPVIICAMYLGPKYGAAMGFVMGFCSFTTLHSSQVQQVSVSPHFIPLPESAETSTAY